MAKRVTADRLRVGDVVVLVGHDAVVQSCDKMSKGAGSEWMWRLTLRTPSGTVIKHPYDLDEFALRT